MFKACFAWSLVAGCRIVTVPHCQGSGAATPAVSGVSISRKLVPNGLVQEVPRCDCWQQPGSAFRSEREHEVEHSHIVMAVGFRVLL